MKTSDLRKYAKSRERIENRIKMKQGRKNVYETLQVKYRQYSTNTSSRLQTSRNQPETYEDNDYSKFDYFEESEIRKPEFSKKITFLFGKAKVFFSESVITNGLLLAVVILGLFFLYYYLPPRYGLPCSNNLWLQQIGFINREVLGLQREVIFEYSKNIGLKRRAPCVHDIYDVCGKLPDYQNESRCDIRFGSVDNSCGCSSRRIYPNYGAFVNSSMNEDYCCVTHEFDLLFQKKFNRVKNENPQTFHILDLFFGNTNFYYTFPARRFKDEVQHPSLGTCKNVTVDPLDTCQTGDPSKESWIKSQTNRLTDFCIVYDNSNPTKTNYMLNTLLPTLLDEIFVANRICVISYDQNSMEFVQLSKMFPTLENKQKMKTFFGNYSDMTVGDIFSNLQNAESLLFGDSGGTKDLSLVIVTDHDVSAAISYTLPTAMNKLSVLYVGNDGSTISHLNSFASLSTKTTLILSDMVSGPTLIDNLQVISNTFYLSIVNQRVVWIVFPSDEYDQNKVVSVSVGINTPNFYGAMGINFLWDSFHDVIDDFDETDLLQTSTMTAVNSNYAFVRYGIPLIVLFFVVVLLALLYLILKVCLKQTLMFKSYFFLSIVLMFIFQRIFDYFLVNYSSTNLFFAIGFLTLIIFGYAIFPLFSIGLIGGYKFPDIRESKVVSDPISSFQNLEIGLDVSNYFMVIGDYTGNVSNFQIQKGSIVTILGHSSAGKTQFIKFLLNEQLLNSKAYSDVYVNVNDKIKIKKFSCKVESLLDLQSFIGYVPQNSIVSEFLTVSENVFFNKSQKFDLSDIKVMAIMRELNLMEHLDKYPSQLSGGSLKRLAVAQCLVQSYPFIILDEPTSGLDTSNSLGLMRIFRKLADRGITILITMHQPSQEILELVDKVYLFCLKDKNMRAWVVPPLENKIDFVLKNYTNPNFSMSNLKKWSQKDKSDYDDNNKGYENLGFWRKALGFMNEGIRNEKISFLKRIYMILAREILREIRNTKDICVTFLSTFSVGACVLFVFILARQFEGVPSSKFEGCINKVCADINPVEGECSAIQVEQGCSFPKYNIIFNIAFLLCHSAAFSSMVSGLFWFSEKNLIRMESRNGYNLFFYFISKLFVQIPRMMLNVLLLLTICYTGLCLLGNFFEYYFTLLCVSFAVSGLAVCISLFFPDQGKGKETVMLGSNILTGLIFLSSIWIPEEHFSGIFFLNGIFKYVSFIYYGVSQILTIETNEYIDKYPETVKNLWELYKFSYTAWNYFVLLIMGSVFFCVAYIIMYLKYTSSFTLLLHKVKYKIGSILNPFDFVYTGPGMFFKFASQSQESHEDNVKLMKDAMNGVKFDEYNTSYAPYMENDNKLI